MEFNKKADWGNTTLPHKLAAELQRMDDGIAAIAELTIPVVLPATGNLDTLIGYPFESEATYSIQLYPGAFVPTGNYTISNYEKGGGGAPDKITLYNETTGRSYSHYLTKGSKPRIIAIPIDSEAAGNYYQNTDVEGVFAEIGQLLADGGKVVTIPPVDTLADLIDYPFTEDNIYKIELTASTGLPSGDYIITYHTSSGGGAPDMLTLWSDGGRGYRYYLSNSSAPSYCPIPIDKEAAGNHFQGAYVDDVLAEIGTLIRSQFSFGERFPKGMSLTDLIPVLSQWLPDVKLVKLSDIGSDPTQVDTGLKSYINDNYIGIYSGTAAEGSEGSFLFINIYLNGANLQFRLFTKSFSYRYFSNLVWEDWAPVGSEIKDEGNYYQSNTVEGALQEIGSLLKVIPVTSWKAVQSIVQSGNAASMFNIGDQLVCNHKEYGELVWDIIGINHDTPSDSSKRYSMTLQLHNVLSADGEKSSFQFSAATPDVNYGHGSQEWETSDIRNWLNSTFLQGLDPECLGVLGKVTKRTVDADNNVVTTEDKMFLLSDNEFDKDRDKLEGDSYAYYADNPSTNSIHIKYDHLGQAAAHWTRSINEDTGSTQVHFVESNGTMRSKYGDTYLSIAPACCIV